MIPTFQTLEELTKWALTQSPPKVFPNCRFADHNKSIETNYPGFDLYIQDEYTHDIVVPISDDCYLVYDTT